MYKFALGCGPTGGHLIPASIVGKEISKRGHRAVIYSSADADNQLVSNLDVEYQRTNMEGWQGGPLTRMRVLAKTLREVVRLYPALSDFDALISFGGYSSVPLLLAAIFQQIPVFVQEQNRVPGKASLMAGYFAEWCFWGLPLRKKWFDYKSSLTGNPLRRCEPVDSEWFAENRLLIVLGGSQGALSLSESLEESLPGLIERNWHIYYIRGKYGRDLEEFNSDENFRQVEFELQLPRYLAAADCLWSRAGAGTISEIIHYQIPALLFPYARAADNHQYLNASWLAGCGPSRVVDDDISTEERIRLTEEVASEDNQYSVPWDEDQPAEEVIVNKIVENIG
ncbi:MAG: UDP-N-acetylglucosamine--N-acetylmuramyl-(pentapeptide) pyrophosphoryl-undecaprenol N-acetylglucosamine transferase [bacterium]